MAQSSSHRMLSTSSAVSNVWFGHSIRNSRTNSIVWRLEKRRQRCKRTFGGNLQVDGLILRGAYKRSLHQTSVTVEPRRVAAFDPSTFLLPVPIMVGAPSVNRRRSTAERSSTLRGMSGSIFDGLNGQFAISHILLLTGDYQGSH